jgi:hypothetical protein
MEIQKSPLEQHRARIKGYDPDQMQAAKSTSVITLILSTVLVFTYSIIPAWGQKPGRFENAVRLFGWIQSTCYYAAEGWITTTQARESLKALLERLYREHSYENAELLRSQAARDYPECEQYLED